MTKPYTEKTFTIGLISDVYKTIDATFIKEKCEEDLNVILTENEINDYLCFNEEYEKESDKIMMQEIFN